MESKSIDRETAISRLGGVRAYEQFTEANFKRDEENGAAFDACRAFDASKQNIYLFGKTGTGKTHLATIAAKRSAWAVLYKTGDMLRSIRTAALDCAEKESEAISYFIKASPLVIDDFGIEKNTEFGASAMYEIIDGRYQAMSGGLIVTSNLSLGELAKKMGDDRIPSRLAGMCSVFRISGNDRRIGGRNGA